MKFSGKVSKIERPRCRKVIVDLLNSYQNLTLEDIAYPNPDDIKIITSEGLKIQARKTIYERCLLEEMK